MGEKPKYEIPRLTEDDMKSVATGLVKGHIFTGSQCPPDLLPMVFFPLMALQADYEVDWEDVGNLYEDISKASNRAVNGFPFFFSCHIVHKDDWAVISERALAAQAALDEALG